MSIYLQACLMSLLVTVASAILHRGMRSYFVIGAVLSPMVFVASANVGGGDQIVCGLIGLLVYVVCSVVLKGKGSSWNTSR